jgi:hypothetical protein
MASGELGREHEHLLETVTDEDVARHRELFKELFPDQSDYISNKSDMEIRNTLARVAWLAALLGKKDS